MTYIVSLIVSSGFPSEKLMRCNWPSLINATLILCLWRINKNKTKIKVVMLWIGANIFYLTKPPHWTTFTKYKIPRCKFWRTPGNIKSSLSCGSCLRRLIIPQSQSQYSRQSYSINNAYFNHHSFNDKNVWLLVKI